ncbi:MAG TPA: patatin family protein [Spirochaetota bacterium]|nr:patatin family protein [Spirochaetota bacterium]HPJ38730.1 patatin family protein [Spirochaetota bacterium]HPQ52144.1 patatin family protein [Spirochaetota bacterium]
MKAKNNKSALVVEGGGMRGVFSAGVLHAFGEIGFNPFDLYIGVSAGACNLASHLAGQNDRNFDIIMRYSSTKQFINPLRFLRGGHYMDLDWLWDVTIREYRLDLKTIFTSLARDKKEFIVVTTSMNSGNVLYLRPDEETLEEYLKASSSLPVLYRTILKIDGEEVTDGGIADPVPVIEAFRRGARTITVIRSRPAGYIKKKERFGFLVSRYMKQYPGFVEAFRRRHAAYMEAVDFINNPPDGVVVHEITPDSTVAMSRTTKDKKSLSAAYQAGMKEGMNFFKAGRSGTPAK